MSLQIPYHRQEKSTTCGPACVRMVTEYIGMKLSEMELEEGCETSWLGNTCEELAAGVQKMGFSAEIIENFTKEHLQEIIQSGTPIVALLDPAVLYGGVQGFGHFVVITSVEADTIYYHDPDMGPGLAKNRDLFFNAWEKFSYKGVRIWRSTKR